MDRYGVSVGVGKHKGPPKWTIERLRDDPNPGINKPIMQGLGVIGFEPQCDAPAETLANPQRSVDPTMYWNWKSVFSSLSRVPDLTRPA
jgi:hypothetical protein